MSVPPVPPGSNTQSSYWAQGEVPPGSPMPLNSPWVKYMEKLWPNVDPGILSMYAAQFLKNMMQILNNAIQNNQKKAHEAAQKMKQAILGND